MLDSWMISLAIALLSSISTYAVLKYRVSATELLLNKHIESDKIEKKDLDRKLNAQFKRIDSINEKQTVLEQASKTFLDVEKAEEQFVQSRELELHLQALELKMQFTKETIVSIQQSIEKTEGKLEELVSLLHEKG